ncbi:hypothetical protein FHS31_001859 [Sphingomonas vulcanisoli]|uniref:Uncharacterized protein n=1 Tax=Sphingomonas vulcanisoli TaxID=1658060 RepID=A0ABX0TRT7_9SPHN|nr:hypothetical protein [Sphingomonas vulcanisoli]NIJ08242.1 hypothetical protein [Sphingomonas vulcanisoli]
MDAPGHYYPLFFHDEAVALAAGHRPCGECRPEALISFIAAWKAGHRIKQHERVPLIEIDRACHQSRLSEQRRRRIASLSDTPEGAFIFAPEIDHRPILVASGYLWPWQHGGYEQPIAWRGIKAEVILLTPEPMIAALRMGYASIVASNLHLEIAAPAK